MSHHDDDWDSSVVAVILEFLLYTDDELSGWKVTLVLFLVAVGLLIWHHYG